MHLQKGREIQTPMALWAPTYGKLKTVWLNKLKLMNLF
jgi:hypothetical protein